MGRALLMLLAFLVSPAKADVIWGSEEYGFWSAQDRTAVFRPGSHSISVFERQKNQCRPLSWKASTGHSEKGIPASPGAAQGDFSVPYFLVNGFLPAPNDSRKIPEGQSFVAVVNRRGETVWSYFPLFQEPSSDPRTQTLVTKQVAPGLIGMLRPWDKSYFEIVNLKGQRQWSLYPKNFSTPLHHDFLVTDYAARRLLSFTNAPVTAKRWWKFWAKPTSFLVGPLVAIDGLNGSSQELWRYSSFRPPFQNADWDFSAEDSRPAWVTWGAPTAQNAYDHTNSFQYLPGEGYLISARNPSQLIFLDEKFSVRWSIGKSSQNTYVTAETPALFHRQHTAQFVEKNKILLFDNGLKESRVLLLRLSPEHKRIEMEREWFTPQRLFSERRGSASPLKDGNFLGYFPNASADPTKPEYIYEFTRDDTEPVARLRINWGYNGAGYRATPLYALGEETFLGFRLPAECAKNKR